LAVATAVDELGAPPPPMTIVSIEEGRTTVEMVTPKRHWSHQSGLARAAQTW
jgi:hypothetical protein